MKVGSDWIGLDTKAVVSGIKWRIPIRTSDLLHIQRRLFTSYYYSHSSCLWILLSFLNCLSNLLLPVIVVWIHVTSFNPCWLELSVHVVVLLHFCHARRIHGLISTRSHRGVGRVSGGEVMLHPSPWMERKRMCLCQHWKELSGKRTSCIIVQSCSADCNSALRRHELPLEEWKLAFFIKVVERNEM